jgi:hypothetical protein
VIEEPVSLGRKLQPSQFAFLPSETEQKVQPKNESNEPEFNRTTVIQKFQRETGRPMRFYEGDYAYEVERVMDAATQLYTGWRYNVYRIRPDQGLLRSGNAETQEEAEREGKKVLAELLKGEGTEDKSGHRAA